MANELAQLWSWFEYVQSLCPYCAGKNADKDGPLWRTLPERNFRGLWQHFPNDNRPAGMKPCMPETCKAARAWDRLEKEANHGEATPAP
jgi:hypothetical protein